MKILRRGVALAAVVALLALAATVAWCDRRVRAYLAGPPLGGTRIYAAPTVLHPGDPLAGGSLARKLTRLGYTDAGEDDALPAGTFRVANAAVTLAQRESPVPGAAAPRRVRVSIRAGRIAELRDVESGTPLDQLVLEPEVLAVLGGGGPTLEPGRDPAPRACRDAVLAAEDRHFFTHPGVDPTAVARALWTDLRAGAREQGGSTITQQLVKNAFLSPRRTLTRKAEEALLALLLEAHASKEAILQRYLASVYLGVEGGLPVHGFAQAAEAYFARPLGDLGPAPCALLAGMIRSPNGLAPRRHARAALARRNRVLEAMARNGSLDADVARRAMAEPLGLATERPRTGGALYVASEVARELERLLPPELSHAAGLTVFTAVDADLQREAERIIRRRLDLLERGRRRRDRLEAALVALDPQTGAVRALVGGRDFASSPLDRAVRSRRQPGSAFKPFVYLAALDPARCGNVPVRTVVSPLEDTPLAVRAGARTWRPENYDRTFLGTVPLEDAIAGSRNAATVHLALDVGMDAVVRAAADLGVRSRGPIVPALALGAGETSLLDLTAAYGVFARGGTRRQPRLVEAVTADGAGTLYTAPDDEVRVIDPAVAYLMTHLLERVVDAGTGRPAREAGLTGPAAGKTGTTDDTRDAWFVGFTPSIVAGVWVGTDAGTPTGFTGAQAALPIWTDFVRAAGGRTEDAFPVPAGITWRDVDPESGGLATPGCPEVRHEPFLRGTEPTAPCPLHRPVWSAVGDGLGEAGRAVGAGLGNAGHAIQEGGRRFGQWLGGLFR